MRQLVRFPAGAEMFGCSIGYPVGNLYVWRSLEQLGCVVSGVLIVGGVCLGVGRGAC